VTAPRGTLDSTGSRPVSFWRVSGRLSPPSGAHRPPTTGAVVTILRKSSDTHDERIGFDSGEIARGDYLCPSTSVFEKRATGDFRSGEAEKQGRQTSVCIGYVIRLLGRNGGPRCGARDLTLPISLNGDVEPTAHPMAVRLPKPFRVREHRCLIMCSQSGELQWPPAEQSADSALFRQPGCRRPRAPD
jgi:hypothetical protein